MLSPCRIARLAAIATCSSAAAACAADPGDAPKQDGIVSGGDASFDVGASPAEAGFEAGGGPADAPAPSLDAGVADAAVEAGPEAAGGDVIEAGALDASPDVASCATCPLVVAYMTAAAAATSQEIRPHLDVTNDGTSPQDLSELTVRYWYTADGSSSQAFACDYAALPSGCSQVAATFVQMPQAKTNADHYMEVSFASGTIAPGGHTGEIQLRFHDTNFAVTFTQTNDYSFDATKTAYAPWDRVTLYRAGTLVWGTEPQ